MKLSLRARGVFGGPTQLAYSAYREDRLYLAGPQNLFSHHWVWSKSSVIVWERFLAAVCHRSKETAVITVSSSGSNIHPNLAPKTNQSGSKLGMRIINLITALMQCQAFREITVWTCQGNNRSYELKVVRRAVYPIQI